MYDLQLRRSQPVVSIVICTLNRCERLRATLKSVAESTAYFEMPVQVIVVDNGSTDETRNAVRDIAKDFNFLHYEFVSRRGQVHARNKGLDLAQGLVILFTDDDVLVCKEWVREMTSPILDGAADATQGVIVIAPELVRSWMSTTHRRMLAEIPAELEQQHQQQPFLIGANMAFGVRVLNKVPRFETALGPGALGYMDDTLFYLQLIEAGYKIQFVKTAVVTHNFGSDRLERAFQVKSAVAHGKSTAWVMKNYAKSPTSFLRLRYLLNLMRALGRRYWVAFSKRTHEGFDPLEIEYLKRAWVYKSLLDKR